MYAEKNESVRKMEIPSKIVDILKQHLAGPELFPPTEIFNEGWMLRLLMAQHAKDGSGMPITKTTNSRWYSEARLSSPFLPRTRGDKLGEGHTHADGVIGHFDFRHKTTAGLKLTEGATQLYILEAKMGSKLTAGTSNA